MVWALDVIRNFRHVYIEIGRISAREGPDCHRRWSKRLHVFSLPAPHTESQKPPDTGDQKSDFFKGRIKLQNDRFFVFLLKDSEGGAGEQKVQNFWSPTVLILNIMITYIIIL